MLPMNLSLPNLYGSLVQHPHRFRIPMLNKAGPPIQLPPLWGGGVGAGRKSPNDVSWETWNKRLSRPVSAYT